MMGGDTDHTKIHDYKIDKMKTETGRTIMLASHIVKRGGRTTTASCEAAEMMREMAFATSGREVSCSAGEEGSPGRLRSGKSRR